MAPAWMRLGHREGTVRRSTYRTCALVAAASMVLLTMGAPAGAHPDAGLDDGHDDHLHEDERDPSTTLEEHDERTSRVVSSGPTAKVTKNLAMVGHGERLLPDGTTDVWALDGYAYLGTFNDPCGDGTGSLHGPGVQVFDVLNPNKPTYVTSIPSQDGSRINDVKVADLNAGAILVHSNERCASHGPGGFEVYDVADPTRPVHLASVRVHDVNATFRDVFGIVDQGVHNLFLFSQGERDFVALQTHAIFGGFQIFEITDPSDPQFVSAWGAELLCEGDFCSDDPYNETDPNVLLDMYFDWMFDGYGDSRNRFLHDVTVSADGTKAYLSHWDAGLILLDISDPSAPALVSVAIDPTAGDGEVNSHAAWPTADGSIVVETEEDFDALVEDRPLDSFTFQERPTNTIPGVGVSTNAGHDFEAHQTGNVVTLTEDALTVESGPLAGNAYEVVEGDGNQPRLADVGPVTGDAVWVGLACDGATLENAELIGEGTIAIARRGECFFGDKLANVAALGASAIVIANNLEDSQWGNVRIWDYSDPANPVLASEFDTVCSADPHDESCDPRGTYSVHNVIVEGTKAYFSWYSDGVLVVDISDPYAPVEVARWHQAGEAWEEANGGIQDVWGIYKEPRKPWIYASDRNGGLYVLQELGSGSVNAEGRGATRP
jgi:hypothetical protein